MGEENNTIANATIPVEEARTDQETPFDRLESRIDTLIERYERLVGEHNQCGERLAEQEGRMRDLEAKLEKSEKQRSEIRARLDTLIEKLSRFS
ncbi:MAG: cell division protein ZapB [Syntrophobacteria bacterium]|jgi:predicted  nucleic acid-binding Zn-ribbon protein